MCFGVDEMTMDEREEHARLVSNVYSNSEHSRESDTRALRERAWLRGLSHRMRSRFELTTPLTSHMRLREGLFTASRLRANPAVGDETAKPMSPYSSGVSHASPLLLWLLSPFGAATHASDGTPIPGVLLDTPFFIIAVLADVAIAFSLRVIAQFYFVRPVGSLLREARTPVRSSPGSAGTAAAAPADAQTNPASNSSESHRAERAEPPSAPPDPLPADPVRAAFALDLAPGVYLFLPMTVLGTVGLSSANLAPAAVLAAAAFAVSAQRARPDFPAMDQALSPRLSESVAGALTGACSAVAIMLDVQSALLVPALVALAVNVNNTLDGVRDSSGTPDADKSGPSLRQTAPAAAHSVGGALVPFLSAFAAVAAVGLGCARQVAPLEHIWDQVVGVSLRTYGLRILPTYPRAALASA